MVKAEPTPSPIELMCDMDTHLAAIGIDPAAYPWGAGLTVPRSYERRVPAAAVARWGRRAAS